MVQKINTPVDETVTAQPSVTSGTSRLGDANVLDKSFNTNVSSLERASGYKSISTLANSFVELLQERAKNNAYLNQFKFGTVPEINPSLGSGAYVAGEIKGAWVYGLVFFEAGSSITVVQENNRETYFTMNSLLTVKTLEPISKTIAAQIGVDQSSLHYVVTNTIPNMNKTMTEEWASKLLGQILMGIYGRFPNYLGTLTMSRKDRFNVTVANRDDGVVYDGNGHAQRADFMIAVQHQPIGGDDRLPTLLDDTTGQALPPVLASGYVNLRYTGRKAPVNGQPDLRQLVAEVLVSDTDAQINGMSTPLERQILALTGAANMASLGGWRDYYLRGLNKSNRRFSALANHLEWGADGAVDTAALDKNTALVEQALDVFAKENAALVVSFRAGNGIGGLSTLLAEIAVGKTNSCNVLLNKLDTMFPGEKDAAGTVYGSFTKVFANKLDNGGSIRTTDIVTAAVPTVTGIYNLNGVTRSMADADLTAVATHLGDRVTEMKTYIFAQSYGNRTMNERDQRIWLMKLLAEMYSGNQPQFTGEGLDMVINPVFAATLVEMVQKNTNWNLNGVTPHDSSANALFADSGNNDFTVSGQGGPNINSDYGLGGIASDFDWL